MGKKTGYATQDEYLKYKDDIDEKSYKDTHKVTDIGLYIFSWFGNAASIFLAYFFIDSLVKSAFIETSSSMLTPIIILLMLALFELLKRHVFSIFSKNVIRNKFSIFSKHMMGYNLTVLLLVGCSFYISLSGAGKFMDNGDVIQNTVEVDITSKVDSINNFYHVTYISPILEENKVFNAQNNEYLTASKRMYASKYTSLIEQNNNKIDANKSKLTTYESERDNKISEIKTALTDKLSKKKNENSSNMLIFILFSTIIEIIILVGIYFDKYYAYRVKKEYEDNVMETPSYKRWNTYSKIADVAFDGITVGDYLPTINDIKEVIITNGVAVSPRDLDNFFKMMVYLKVIERAGSKKVLMLSPDKIKKLLRDYYKIV